MGRERALGVDSSQAIAWREFLWPPSIHGHAQVTNMIIRRNVLAALVSVFSSGTLYADPVATTS